MEKTVSVLLVSDKISKRQLWARYLTPTNGFKVQEASTLRQALQMLPTSDITVVDWTIGNGDDANGVVDAWSSLGGGPMLVCVPTRFSAKDRDDLFVRGVWNILQNPVRTEVFLTVLRRYQRCYFIQSQVADLAVQVKRLKLAVIALGLLMLGIGAGPEAVKLLAGLL